VSGSTQAQILVYLLSLFTPVIIIINKEL